MPDAAAIITNLVGRLSEVQVRNAKHVAAWITLVGNVLLYPCNAGAQITNSSNAWQ